MKKYWQKILDNLNYTGLDPETLDICIHDVMEPVVANGWKFDIGCWQDMSNFGLRMKVKTLHACGSSACFGGHLALAQSFKKRGGTMCRGDGSPRFNGETEDDAVTAFLGLEIDCESSDAGYLLCIYYSGLYDDIDCEKITAQHVLDRLYYIRDINFPETGCFVMKAIHQQILYFDKQLDNAKEKIS